MDKEKLADFVIAQLSDFGNVTPKKMFGGIGLFHNGLMFGMIGGGKFKLKVDDHNQDDYIAAGMQPHFEDKKKKGMPYWEVPAHVLQDKEKLKVWASKSIEAALRSKK